MVKFGINGFGRLGRQLLKVVIKKFKEKSAADLPKVAMVNDATVPIECMAYLLKNDTNYGKFAGDIVQSGDSLTIDGMKIEITKESAVDKIPWNKCGVDYVIDTSGLNTTCASASKHFAVPGIKRVIVTGCSNIPMFIVGVNHACYTKEMKTVSAATPSMNCLGIMLRVLHENFEIDEAMATALHPLTNSDKILDDSSSTCRSSRSILMSFAPTETTAKKIFINKIMPELAGKVDSAAIKIPVPCVGGMDLTLRFRKEALVESIRCRMKDASETYLKEVLGYSDEELVSSDIIGNNKSCVFDSKAIVSLSKCTAKVFAWYDGEYAFASRIYDLAKYICSRENCE